MTENKRFLIGDAGELIDFDNHKFIDYGDECCKLLNEQHEQIERLKDNFRALDEVKCELADENEQLRKENDMFSCELSVSANKEISRNCRIVELEKENEQLKQYKQSVNDVLRSWSQKNLTAKQLQVVLAIMEELNVICDVE